MAEDRRRRSPAVLFAVAVAVSGALGSAPAAAGPPVGAEVAAAVVPATPSRQAPSEGPQLPVDPERDPDRTRARADEILEGRQYQAPASRDRTVLDRLRRWLGDRIPDVSRPEGGDDALDLFSIAVIVVVLGGAATALVLVLRSARRTRRAPETETDVEVDVTPLRSATGWAAEADRCEDAGDHRGAVRARFRALTTTLADRGLVADTPGRTAGELRADVAERAPEVGPSFGAVARQFEDVWFGDAPAGPESSRAARDLAAAVLDVAPRRVDERAAAPVGAGSGAP